MKTLKLKSPAKLNLYLKVINKRPDGYHNIVTLFERINLCDEVTIRRGNPCGCPDNNRAGASPAPAIKITCSDPNIPTGPENLAYKAAKALLDYTGKNLGCQIHIKKRIPVAAGLGGGSSNAATALVGLNQLWQLGLSKKELMKIGAKIGADVNFFLLDSSFAVGTGKGEKLMPVRIIRPMWHVLVAPAKGFSTKEIYQLYHNNNKIAPSPHSADSKCLGINFQHDYSGKINLTAALADVKILFRLIRSNNLTLLAKNLHNDLEEPAAVKDRTILKIKEFLKSSGMECAAMSGSGSCVFGIASSKKRAEMVRQKLVGLKKGWRIFTVKTM